MIVAMGNTAASGCAVFTSNMRVRVAATGRATYPDISMVWGPIEYDADDAVHTTVTNAAARRDPFADHGEGRSRRQVDALQQIASLQEYVLVSQEPRIEIFRRTPSNTWEYFEVREGNVRLATGPAIEVAALYADLPV
jgi:hypothetical protein